MVAGLLGALLSAVAAAGAGATTSTTLPGPAPNQSQINATQSQVSQIEATLTQEEQQTSILDDKYNTAVQNLQNAQSTLQSLAASLIHARSAVDADKRLVATDAVAAYVYGTPESGFASYFSTSATLNEARNQYTNQIVGNLTKDETALQRSETRLAAQEVQQQARGRAGAGGGHAGQVAGTGQRAGGGRDQGNPEPGAGPARPGGRAGGDRKRRSQEAAAAAAAASQRQQQQAAAAAAGGRDRRRRGRRIRQRCRGDQRRQPGRRAAPDRWAGPRRVARRAWPRCRLRSRSWACPTSSAASSPASASTAPGWCSGPGPRPACPSRGRPRRSGPPCTHVSLDALQPGDLLFYYNLDGDNQVDHVVMYTGSGPYGTDTVIQAPFTGSTVSYSPIFTEGLIGRRALTSGP